MQIQYNGPDKRRRVNGKPLREGQVIEVSGEQTIDYFLGLVMNNGKPEFEPVMAVEEAGTEGE